MTMVQVQATDQAIRDRKTQKVLAEDPLPISTRPDFRNTIDELLELAAYAPMHKKCDDKHRLGSSLDSGVPWRVRVLDAVNCRILHDYIRASELQTGKILHMLAAADALLIVTWLPDIEPDRKEDQDLQREPIPFRGDIKNMEHVAAASAAIQNMLIGAAARRIPNYWSSGGHLRTKELRSQIGVPLSEIVLGTIFLFPKNSESLPVEIKTGKLRNEGKDVSSWSTWIDLQVSPQSEEP